MSKRMISLLIGFTAVFTMTACSGNASAYPDPISDLNQDPGSSGIESVADDTSEMNSAPDEAGTAEETDSVNQGTNVLLSVETSMEYQYEWDEERDQQLASCSYPYLHLSNECAEEYPELESALQKRNDEVKLDSERTYDDLLKTAKEDIQNNADHFAVYENRMEVSVRRADGYVLSLLYDGYHYSGGAHGYYYYSGKNFDAATGKQLQLQDVVTDMQALPDAVQQQLDLNWKDVDFYDDLDLTKFFRESEADISWTLDYNGLTIYFNPYDIAPYASGVQNVTLTFAEYPGLLNERYKSIPDRYAVEISLENTFYYDLNQDGTAESILVSGEKNEYDSYEKQTVYVNDRMYEDEIYGYSVEPVFLHTMTGKNYIYIQNRSDNDWRIITVFDLTNGEVNKVDVYPAGWHDVIADEESDDYLSATLVLTDPEEFLLDTHTDLLSTLTGSRQYHVGENGMPKTDQEFYELNRTIPLTFKQPVSVDIIDENDMVTGVQELSTGTEVQYIRTDNERYADLLLPDGSIGRVEVEMKDWERFIQDKDINDLFDGIVFAG